MLTLRCTRAAHELVVFLTILNSALSIPSTAVAIKEKLNAQILHTIFFISISIWDFPGRSSTNIVYIFEALINIGFLEKIQGSLCNET